MGKVSETIRDTIKAGVYRDGRATKEYHNLQTSAMQFIEYGNQIINIINPNVLFVTAPDEFEICTVVQIPGTWAIHFMKRKINGEQVHLDLYLNSQFEHADPGTATH